MVYHPTRILWVNNPTRHFFHLGFAKKGPICFQKLLQGFPELRILSNNDNPPGWFFQVPEGSTTSPRKTYWLDLTLINDLVGGWTNPSEKY